MYQIHFIQHNLKFIFLKDTIPTEQMYISDVSLCRQLPMCYKDVNYCIQNICIYAIDLSVSVYYLLMQFGFPSLLHVFQMYYGGSSWKMRKLESKAVDTPLGKSNLNRVSSMKKSKLFLSPNIQVYVPHLNANLNLAMGGKFTTTRLKN